MASSQYEIFDACRRNDLKRVKDLLDLGVDVNLVDFDSNSTPLLYAAGNGSRHTMEFLLERGANINAQNNRGSTSLHLLCLKRFDSQAVWLVRMGADVNIKDRKGDTAIDLSHGWVQKELMEAATGKVDEKKAAKADNKAAPQTIEQTGYKKEEVMKIYFSNGSYKSIRLNDQHTAAQLASLMAEKIHLPEYGHFFEVVEVRKDLQPRKLSGGENLWEVKSKWPMILGTNGNETYLHYRFTVVVKRGSPDIVFQKYEAASV